jgi:excisionase family DNA binding protein
MAMALEGPDLMTPAEVAAVFRVDPKTVTRWAASGRIASIRTPGGHRRYKREVVEALLRNEPDGRKPDDGQADDGQPAGHGTPAVLAAHEAGDLELG